MRTECAAAGRSELPLLDSPYSSPSSSTRLDALVVRISLVEVKHRLLSAHAPLSVYRPLSEPLLARTVLAKQPALLPHGPSAQDLAKLVVGSGSARQVTVPSQQRDVDASLCVRRRRRRRRVCRRCCCRDWKRWRRWWSGCRGEIREESGASGQEDGEGMGGRRDHLGWSLRGCKDFLSLQERPGSVLKACRRVFRDEEDEEGVEAMADDGRSVGGRGAFAESV